MPLEAEDIQKLLKDKSFTDSLQGIIKEQVSPSVKAAVESLKIGDTIKSQLDELKKSIETKPDPKPDPKKPDSKKSEPKQKAGDPSVDEETKALIEKLQKKLDKTTKDLNTANAKADATEKRRVASEKSKIIAALSAKYNVSDPGLIDKIMADEIHVDENDDYFIPGKDDYDNDISIPVEDHFKQFIHDHPEFVKATTTGGGGGADVLNKVKREELSPEKLADMPLDELRKLGGKLFPESVNRFEEGNVFGDDTLNTHETSKSTTLSKLLGEI